jgi:hypothetical protein
MEFVNLLGILPSLIECFLMKNGTACWPPRDGVRR